MKIFTITFDDLTNNSAVLGILWEDVYVGLKFETPTDAMVSKNIESAMAGPTAQDLYAAADYYLTANKDVQKAKIWIDNAVRMTAKTPRFC